MNDIVNAEIQTIQEKLLKMLTFFNNFCEEKGLSYYVVGGTMLGAARHHGFIPWDDDVDVGMPRNDFEELIKYAGNVFDTYTFETLQSSDTNYCFPFTKLYDTSTLLIENTRHVLKRGLYIDIFPLDGVGDTKRIAEKHYRKIDIIKTLLKLRNSPDKNDRNWYKNLVIHSVRLLPNNIANEKRICQRIDKLCKKYDFNDSKLVANLVGAWGLKEIMRSPKSLRNMTLPVKERLYNA